MLESMVDAGKQRGYCERRSAVGRQTWMSEGLALHFRVVSRTRLLEEG